LSVSSPKSIGKRLAQLREAKGITSQIEMARIIGCELNRYNHWERGRIMLPIEFAIEIAKQTGADLDFIYLGETSGLPINLWKLLSSTSGQS
jgi:transcriptional regulator with XRE-family HTH domain